MIRVIPKVYLVGETQINLSGLTDYLEATDNREFLEAVAAATAQGLGNCEIISSFFSKLCYNSLTLGKNPNLAKTRDIRKNIIGTIESGHGSILEHASLSFVFHDVSRVLTHELVRHRVGVAYSQESGRYCRILPAGVGMYVPTCIAKNPKALELFVQAVETSNRYVQSLYQVLGINRDNFHEKKQLTSAVRRIAPTGMANEIGVSFNLRELRHVIRMRTSRHAEEEIRFVFAQVANIVKEHVPLLLYGGREEIIDDLPEWTFPNQPHL